MFAHAILCPGGFADSFPEVTDAVQPTWDRMTGVAAVIGVLTAACGHGSATTPAPSPPGHPAGKATSCTVISSAEASAALGQDVKGPVRREGLGILCELIDTVVVELTVKPTDH